MSGISMRRGRLADRACGDPPNLLRHFLEPLVTEGAVALHQLETPTFGWAILSALDLGPVCTHARNLPLRLVRAVQGENLEELFGEGPIGLGPKRGGVVANDGFALVLRPLKRG